MVTNANTNTYITNLQLRHNRWLPETESCTNIDTDTDTDTDTDIDTDTHTHTHTCARTHAQTHTHTGTSKGGKLQCLSNDC